MVSLTELRAFQMVAEAGSFSQAARDGAVTQSTLSTQVRALEQTSGTMLFERRARGVRLTTEGAALHDITRRMFEAESDARHFLREGASLAGGRLRVIADGSPIPVRILSQLHRDEPELRFHLTVANSRDVNEALLEYRADVGISAHIPDDGRLVAQPFARAALMAMMPVGHRFGHLPSVSLAELLQERMIIRERGSQTRAVLEANLIARGMVMQDVMEIGRQDAVREMVASGFGLGVTAALEMQPDSRLQYCPIHDADILMTEYVICIQERRRSPLVRAFIQKVGAIDWDNAAPKQA